MPGPVSGCGSGHRRWISRDRTAGSRVRARELPCAPDDSVLATACYGWLQLERRQSLGERIHEPVHVILAEHQRRAQFQDVAVSSAHRGKHMIVA